MKANRIPPWAEIGPSQIPGAGLGVFAKLPIPAGRLLGEYRGRRLTPEQYRRLKDNPYVWEVRDDRDDPIFYLDAARPRHANWTRYVNCPRTRDEENLAVRQESLRIYFDAKRDISAGEELLIWYGAAYGEWLGIPSLD
jgi:SET domain-containing protein